MRKNVCLPAALFFFCAVSFVVSAQTVSEEIESGRFGAEEPAAGTVPDDAVHKGHWLFLGAHAGPSLRFYTPSGDTAFTGGDTFGVSLEAGLQADLRIAALFSVQAEMLFTWDNASVWQYALNAAGNDLDRYTRRFQSFSLQLPLTARLNFYPGRFRVSPFFGGYVVLPLGSMETGSYKHEDESFSYTVSPPVGLLGGLCVAYPLKPGIIFADLRYAADLGNPDLHDSGGLETYRRHAVTLSLGFEFGFFQKREGSK
ncbi:MAG: PorT family protein [Spirochaetaceae bacterium]|jgi:hypothetical protein|nr:PorT family protein [Spirochaetaceae bacterium]